MRNDAGDVPLRVCAATSPASMTATLTTTTTSLFISPPGYSYENTGAGDKVTE
jgi:hypothetical protein